MEVLVGSSNNFGYCSIGPGGHLWIPEGQHGRNGRKTWWFLVKLANISKKWREKTGKTANLATNFCNAQVSGWKWAKKMGWHFQKMMIRPGVFSDAVLVGNSEDPQHSHGPDKRAWNPSLSWFVWRLGCRWIYWLIMINRHFYHKHIAIHLVSPLEERPRIS